MPNLFVFYYFFVRALLMPQNFIFNIFSDLFALFALLIIFLCDFSYFPRYSFFLFSYPCRTLNRVCSCSFPFLTHGGSKNARLFLFHLSSPLALRLLGHKGAKTWRNIKTRGKTFRWIFPCLTRRIFLFCCCRAQGSATPKFAPPGPEPN